MPGVADAMHGYAPPGHMELKPTRGHDRDDRDRVDCEKRYRRIPEAPSGSSEQAHDAVSGALPRRPLEPRINRQRRGEKQKVVVLSEEKNGKRDREVPRTAEVGLLTIAQIADEH